MLLDSIFIVELGHTANGVQQHAVEKPFTHRSYTAIQERFERAHLGSTFFGTYNIELFERVVRQEEAIALVVKDRGLNFFYQARIVDVNKIEQSTKTKKPTTVSLMKLKLNKSLILEELN